MRLSLDRDCNPEATVELCGLPFDERSPRSPRCMVALHQHAGRPHTSFGPGGGKLEWTGPRGSLPQVPNPWQ